MSCAVRAAHEYINVLILRYEGGNVYDCYYIPNIMKFKHTKWLVI